MMIPDKFKFHIPSEPDFIYFVEYNKKEGTYRIGWTGGDASMKCVSYSKEMVESAFRRGIWRLTDIQTNEEALALLSHD